MKKKKERGYNRNPITKRLVYLGFASSHVEIQNDDITRISLLNIISESQ